jgi:hypothetical protein
MSFDIESLYALLPAVHRLRDAEAARSAPLLPPAEAAELAILQVLAETTGLSGEEALRHARLDAKARTGPLKALLTLVAEQAQAIEADLDQLYEDSFIETCAPWVVPYIGDLVGYRAVRTGGALAAPRAEVANTIAARRRKGTAAMLEQTARDLTGLDASAVEYFRRLAVTQQLNHLRAGIGTARLTTAPDAFRGGAFDHSARSAEVRRIGSRGGRYNIGNLGIFLWRSVALPTRHAPAVRVDARRFLFSPLGIDIPLWAEPVTERDLRSLAGPENVPAPLGRRRLAAELARHYGTGLLVLRGDVPVPLAEVRVCCLADTGPDPATSPWANLPTSGIAIDPELGRLAFSADQDSDVAIRVSFLTGGNGRIGGGPYARAATLDADAMPLRIPADAPDLGAALADPDFPGEGVVEWVGDDRAMGAAVPPVIQVAAQRRLEIRAADGAFPTLAAAAPILLTGGDGAELTLNGLRLDGAPLVVPALVGGVPNGLQVLRLRHCTLVPGGGLDRSGNPRTPGVPSLIIEAENVLVEIESCVLGAIRATEEARLRIRDSVVDANGAGNAAVAAQDGVAAGAPLWMFNTTIIGTVHTRLMGLCSNSILLGTARSSQMQQGIVRHSLIAPGSILPRRYACVAAEDVPPRFSSLRYPAPDYARLSPECDRRIRRGADDEGEMGAFHDAQEAAREAALLFRLEESLPLGLEAGIFHTAPR